MSWETLLSEIAKKYLVSKDTVASNILAYEQLKATVLARNIKVSSESFAFSILEQLDAIQQETYNEIFSVYLSLPIEVILTTNFDYAIERALVNDYQYKNYTKNVFMPQETKCSCIRYSDLEGKKIFHIHGELGKPGTVCLGNVHYVENLNKLMIKMLNYDKDSDMHALKDEVFGDSLLSWAQYFFTRNIYIIGLGLYDCDMDLWWLIAYRQQLKLEGDERIKNKIVYYYLYEKKDQNFVDCLKAMDIDVRENKVENDDWKSSYIALANDIKDNLGG